MERITKIIILLTAGMLAISVSRLFYFLPNLFFPLFFTVVGYIMYKELIRHKQVRLHPIIIEHAIPLMLMISLMLMYVGHGMNYGANIISHNLQGASDILKSTVFFYDEILSHKFLFVGFFSLFFTGMLLQISRPFSFKMKKSDEITLGICGVLFGLGLATSLIEGLSANMGLMASAILLPFLLFHHQKHTLRIVIRKYPLNYFIAIICITMLAFFAAYYAHYGSFIEPSKVLCNMGYIQTCIY